MSILQPLTEEELFRFTGGSNTGIGAIQPVDVEELEGPPEPERSVWGAGMRLENIVASNHAFFKDKPGLLTPEEIEELDTGYYNYEDHIPEDLQDYATDYARYAPSERHATWLTGVLRQELQDRQTIEEGGIPGFLASAFGALSSPEQYPAYFIPGTLLLKGTTLAGSRAAMIGAEVGIAAGSTALGETLLHQTQLTRTLEESSFNIAASALFAGAITGGIIGFNGAYRSGKEFAKELDADQRLMADDARLKDMEKSMGAAETMSDPVALKQRLVEDRTAKLDQAKQANNQPEVKKIQKELDELERMRPEKFSELQHPRLAKALGFASPAIRIATSRSHLARELGALLVDDPMLRVRNQFGSALPPSIESQMSAFEQQVGFKLESALDEINKQYKALVKEGKAQKMDYEKLSQRLSKALRNGDVDELGSEFITASAKRLRKEIMDPITERLDAQDLLPRHVTNWDKLKADDVADLLEEEQITKYFKQDGSARANVDSLPSEIKNTLIRSGKLQTEISNPLGDKSYLHRLWDFDAIGEDPRAFRAKISQYLEEKAINKKQAEIDDAVSKTQSDLDSINQKIDKLEPKVKKNPETLAEAKMRQEDQAIRKANGEKVRRKRHEMLNDLRLEKMQIEDALKQPKRITAEDIAQIKQNADSAADEIYNGIMDMQFNPNTRSEYKTHYVGPLKLRTVDIPTHIVEEFVENDLNAVMHHYTKHINTQLHMKETFDPAPQGVNRTGEASQSDGINWLNDKIDAVNKDYLEQARNAPDLKGEKKIEKERKATIRDLEAMRDVLYNRYKLPSNPTGFWSQAAARLRELNVMSMLGQVTISSIPDLANYIARRGLVTFARDLTRLATNFKTMRLSARVTKKAGMSADLANSGRLEKMYLMDDAPQPLGKSRIGQGWNNARTMFGKLTGMPYWNNFWKSMTATSYIDDIAVDAMKASQGKLSSKKLQAYARGGLGEDELKAISRQLNKDRDMVDGIWIPDVEKWSDQALAEKFRAVVRKEVDMTVVTPGKGDLPLMSRGEMGKMIFQFKSFSMAANQRIVMAGLDQMSFDKVAGLLTGVMLGYVSYAAKQTLKGEEFETDYDTIVREGFDRSGQLAYWGDLNGMLSKATQGQLDAYRLTGADKAVMTRYASRNMLGAILGINAGRVQDVGQLVGAVANGDFTESDIRAARRFMIYQNLWATNYGLSLLTGEK